MPLFGLTANYKFKLIEFDTATWHDDEYDNWRLVDGLLNQFLQISGIEGVWANSTSYIVGNRVVDGADGSLWEAAVVHTSAAAPTTFVQDRAANPTYWVAVGASAFAADTQRMASQARLYAGQAQLVYSQVLLERTLASEIEANVEDLYARTRKQANTALATAFGSSHSALNAANSAAEAAASAVFAATAVRMVTNVAALTAVASGTLTDGSVMSAAGYYAALDGGGGLFRWNAASTATADDGLVFEADDAPATGRWFRIVPAGYVNVLWFGAIADDATDNRPFFQTALDAGNGKVVHAPTGTYRFTTVVDDPSAPMTGPKHCLLLPFSVRFYGDGAGKTVLNFTNTNHRRAIARRSGTTAKFIEVEGLSVLMPHTPSVSGNTPNSHCIYIENTEDSRIVNNYVQGAGDGAIRVDGADGVGSGAGVRYSKRGLVGGNNTYDNYIGIEIEGFCEHVDVVGNWVRLSYQHGIRFPGARVGHCERNHIDTTLNGSGFFMGLNDEFIENVDKIAIWIDNNYFTNIADNAISGVHDLLRYLSISGNIAPDLEAGVEHFVSDNANFVGLDKTFNANTDVDLTTDIITLANHRFMEDNIVTYSNEGGTSITPLVHGSNYYVKRVDPNSFKLGLTEAGGAIDLTAKPASQTHKLTGIGAYQRYIIRGNITTGSIVLNNSKGPGIICDNICNTLSIDETVADLWDVHDNIELSGEIYRPGLRQNFVYASKSGGAAQTNATGDGTDVTLVFDTEHNDDGRFLNSNTTFTAQFKREYTFEVGCLAGDINTTDHTTCLLRINVNGGATIHNICRIGAGAAEVGGDQRLLLTGTKTLELNRGDTVTFELRVNGTNKIVDVEASLDTYLIVRPA